MSVGSTCSQGQRPKSAAIDSPSRKKRGRRGVCHRAMWWAIGVWMPKLSSLSDLLRLCLYRGDRAKDQLARAREKHENEIRRNRMNRILTQKLLKIMWRHPDEIAVDSELALLVTADGDLKILVDDVEMVCIEGAVTLAPDSKPLVSLLLKTFQDIS